MTFLLGKYKFNDCDQSFEKSNKLGLDYYILRIGVFFLIFTFIVLPSGTVFGFPIKHISYFICLAGVLVGGVSDFLISGFTNQYLVSSASGVFYKVHVVMASILRNRNSQYSPH